MINTRKDNENCDGVRNNNLKQKMGNKDNNTTA
jgi:hypothetical protein